MTILTTYLDPSGGEPDSDVQCVAGFLARPEQWDAFNEEWVKRLRDDGLTWFHMTDFENYQGEFAD